ncbi:restriction endonuclease subunit S [Burkholderia gladioli]|uniref:restriction endonuclease subunit S n=1 Tax=Burkholderia gladioli TaxID=28095 RepID=UPI001C5D594A|nr:restriction endonuclease subunit S [Burkholderia gladioli]MBW5286366.1 restriction endonuclease subunit S [Burkholderia gladioli]
MKVVRLGDVCAQDRQSVKPGERPELRYIGLESIESGGGGFVAGDLSKTPETPTANSFRFTPEHVLYGKLRPYLNKVALPAFEGKCSTEIIPLRPSSDIDRAYLAYFLRHQQVVDLISARVAGARMPRADMDLVLSLPIPLPDLAEQRRIVDLLSRAEGIVRLRREAQAKAQAIIPALFVDMFGDPATNAKGWSKCPLGELICSGPTNGLYKHKSLYGRGTPILRIDAFYSGKIKDPNALKRVELESDIELKRFELKQGDIVINRVNSPEYLGKSAIIPELQEPIVFESNMMRFSVNRARVLPEFAIAQLQQPAARNHFLANAKHAINQSSINQQDVKSLLMIVPPLPAQVKFVEWSTNANSILVQQVQALRTAEQTFVSILEKLFGR